MKSSLSRIVLRMLVGAAGCAIAVAVWAAPEKPLDYQEEVADQQLEMVGVQGGTYKMARYLPGEQSIADLTNYFPITVSPFWIAKYETRLGLFRMWSREYDFTPQTVAEKRAHAAYEIKGHGNTDHGNVEGIKEPNYPVVGIHQWSAKRFCHWLSMRTGKFYRLPTEAEWEYACRGGNPEGPFPWGYEVKELDKYAVTSSRDHVWAENLRPVGTKQPNGWGIHDMIGNVEEWVADGYEFHRYLGQKKDPITWPASRRLSQNPESVWDEFKKHEQHYCEGWGVTKGGSSHFKRCQDPICFTVAARTNLGQIAAELDPRRPKQDEPSDFDGEMYNMAVGFRVVRPVVIPDRKFQLWHWGIYFDHDKWLDLTLEPTAEMK